MNEYLENLRNTQGKKSPSKLTDTYRNIKMTLSGQSPEKKCKISTFDVGGDSKLNNSFEENSKQDILKNDHDWDSDEDPESPNNDSDGSQSDSISERSEAEETDRVEIKQVHPDLILILNESFNLY